MDKSYKTNKWEHKSKRKFIAKLVVIAFLAVLVAIHIFNTFRRVDEIALVSLGSAQQEIVNLLSPLNGAFIYSFQTREAFDLLEVWIDVYNYGELAEEAIVKLATSNSQARDGLIGLVVDRDWQDNNKITFTVSASLGGSILRAMPKEFYMSFEEDRQSGIAWSANEESVSIIDGEEILLFSAVANRGNVVSTSTADAPQSYIFKLKARFSN